MLVFEFVVNMAHLEDVALEGERLEGGANIVGSGGRVNVWQEVVVSDVAVFPGGHDEGIETIGFLR
jgi:hypothetical protein